MKRTLFCLLVFGMLVSCEDDHNSAVPNDNNTDLSGNNDNLENLPNDVKQFVGYWINEHIDDQTWASNYLFRADGTCMQISHHGDYYEGSWNFDPTTKQLSTTAGDGKIWNITISNDYEWMGSSNYNDRVWNFKKASDNDLYKLIIHSYNWNGDSGTLDMADELEEAYNGTGYNTYNDYGNLKDTYYGSSIGSGYGCSGSFINIVERSETDYQNWFNSYLMNYEPKYENSYNEYTYTLYREGSKRKKRTIYKKTYLSGRWVTVSQEVEYSVPSDCVDGSGTFKISNPLIKRDVTIEFTGRLSGILTNNLP